MINIRKVSSFSKKKLSCLIVCSLIACCLLGNNFEIKSYEWDEIETRAYRILVPKDITERYGHGYTELYYINDKQTFKELQYSCRIWQKSIRPELEHLVDRTAYLREGKVQKLLERLRRIASGIENIEMGNNSRGQSIDQLEKELRSVSADLKKEVDALSKKAVYALHHFERFAYLNASVEKHIQDEAEEKKNVRSSIERFNGVLNAIEDDLASLLSKINKLPASNRLIIDVAVEEVSTAWNNISTGIKSFGKYMHVCDAYRVNFIEMNKGKMYQIQDNEWVLEINNQKQRIKEVGRSNQNIYFDRRSNGYGYIADIWNNKLNENPGNNTYQEHAKILTYHY